MRRLLAGRSTAAVLTAGTAAMARSSDGLVWGDTLPAGLDPHVVYDVPMQMFMLNAYDGLYHHVGNPSEGEPWLAPITPRATTA